MRKLNRDAQILADIQDGSEGRWVRVYRKDGTAFEGYVSCWTWTTMKMLTRYCLFSETTA